MHSVKYFKLDTTGSQSSPDLTNSIGLQLKASLSCDSALMLVINRNCLKDVYLRSSLII